MAYKTPEQMLEIIKNEHLLTDACMTIIDGRNEFGFHAAEVPSGSVKDMGDGSYEITIFEDDDDLHIPVHIPVTDKETTFWLISFKKGEYNIIAVQHDKGAGEYTDVKKKEYMSVIALFLDHYHIGTRMRLIGVLQYGYEQLKKELNEKNEYKLLRDYMDSSIDIRRAEKMPDKYGIRFHFHFDDAE